MLDIPRIYNDPILFRARRGNATNPFVKVKEYVFIDKGMALLREVPSELDKVKVTGLDREWVEIQEGLPTRNTYKVDYTNGVVYFHESINGRTLLFEYMGRGVFLFPDSRVYLTDKSQENFPTAREKFNDIDRAILVQKNRVDTLIIENPQPSEVVDIRIDYNGKIFPVAKDRIDAEQKKIEEAYVDANGVKFPSLKERIDSLQKATEEQFDEQEQENTRIWATIDLVPGWIRAETGKLSERLDGESELLRSHIEMTPELINAEVLKVREYVDGEVDYAKSAINMLADEIDMKVDVNGVINSINISKEGVAIDGSKLRITAETHIDKAVIKDAHIDSLSANKIRTGVLSSSNNNTRFNLNTGRLDMENANFYLGNGGRIYFEDSGNKIAYQRQDYETGEHNSAGFGVGTSINNRFPFAYMGTTNTRRGSLGAYDEGEFTGFITNTIKRMDVDNIGNSVVGDYFHIRDKAISYKKGLVFDLSTNRITMRGMNTGSYKYDLGETFSRFSRVYADHFYGDNITFNYHGGGSRLGYIMENTVKNGRNPAFRPQYGGELYYNLGTSYHVWRHGYINVLHYNSLRQRSLREYKEDIKLLDPQDAINYIKNTDVHTFYYKEKDDNHERTEYDLKVGIIHDDIEIEKDYLVKADEKTVDQSNIMYMIQAATKNLIERVELLEKENEQLKAKLQ